MLTRLAALAGAVATCLLAVAAALLVVHHPTISNTSQGDFRCLAPYDTVINHADNAPHGVAPGDAAAIGARCQSIGDDRFVVAVVAAVASVAFAAVTVVVIRRRRYE
ncbi:MAG: hypothetical protein JWR52_2895 [Marmoricola sp.]|nr:hypothetical protein [Marmoricola sp.]